jgi:hypothetical protein
LSTSPEEIRRPKVACPQCGKKVRLAGVQAHLEFAHYGGKERAALDALGDRVLTEQELDAIDMRADIDFLDKHRLRAGRIERAVKDREMLLGHIRALARLQLPQGPKP